MNLCGLILAAGGSTRLGRPKQLVKSQDKTLLQLAIENALNTSLQDVYVVLGANKESIEASIKHLPVQLIENAQWQEGLGSSISAGMHFIQKQGNYDAVLIMLCDQLHVNAAHLQAIIDAYLQKGAKMVATEYGKQLGVPALFDRMYFTDLAQLSGDTGAKKLLQVYAASLYSIPFEQALIDIDTPEDLNRLGLAH
jgi:molybdenum cofactor cytidylyltransferase